MSGVVIGVKDGKIISRIATLSMPKPSAYPRTRLGITFHFIPGASIARFPIGAEFKETPHVQAS